jgi:heat shock protein HtpX
MHGHMLDDRLIEELLARDAAAAAPSPPDPLQRAGRLVALLAILCGVVVGAIAWLVAGPILAGVAFVVVLIVIVGVLGWLIWRPAEDRVLVAIGGRTADPVADARLLNLVEGLCTATGLRVPTVRVVEAPGMNALAAGRSATSAVLAVTSGLIAGLSRIELEGVLAEEVVTIRRELMVPATIAASVPPALSKLFDVRPGPELDADRAAVTLTRYPPGLHGALEKMAELGTAVAAPSTLDALWLASPHPTDPGATPVTPTELRVPLAERIEALAEL